MRFFLNLSFSSDIFEDFVKNTLAFRNFFRKSFINLVADFSRNISLYEFHQEFLKRCFQKLRLKFFSNYIQNFPQDPFSYSSQVSLKIFLGISTQQIFLTLRRFFQKFLHKFLLKILQEFLQKLLETLLQYFKDLFMNISKNKLFHEFFKNNFRELVIDSFGNFFRGYCRSHLESS